jgi:hypothetical protein
MVMVPNPDYHRAGDLRWSTAGFARRATAADVRQHRAIEARCSARAAGR